MRLSQKSFVSLCVPLCFKNLPPMFTKVVTMVDKEWLEAKLISDMSPGCSPEIGCSCGGRRLLFFFLLFSVSLNDRLLYITRNLGIFGEFHRVHSTAACY